MLHGNILGCIREEFILHPGAKLRLDRIDPSYKGKHESHEKAAPVIAESLAHIGHLQYLLYGDAGQSLPIVLQGLHAAGKDGVVRHLFTGMNPQRRQWKISESDYSEREFWTQYMQAYEEAIERTSTKLAPWFVIPANHKWFRDLAISQIVADAMSEMNLMLPPPRVDPKEIREKYHAAVDESRRKNS